MKKKEIGLDQRIADVKWILNFFWNQHTEVNHDALLFMRKLYEINLLMQQGEKITQENIEELTTFFVKLLHQSLNYQLSFPWLNEHISKLNHRGPSQESNLFYKVLPLYSNKPQLNCLIFFPFYLSSYTDGLVTKLVKIKDYGNSLKYREQILYGITQWLNTFQTSEMQFWLDMDGTLENAKEKFDQCFVKSKSVKVVCLKLYDQRDYTLHVDSITDQALQFSHTRMLRHLEIFKKRISQNERILAQFQKLEFGTNYDFSIFGVFVFNNHSSEGMQSLADEIKKSWINSYTESRTNSDASPITTQALTASIKYNCLPQIELISPQILPSGVITKGSERYNEFIRKTLNYVVNSPKLFELWIEGKECKNVYSFVNEPLLSKRKALKEKIEADKKTRKRPESTAEKVEFGLLKYFTEIKLRAMEKKSIKNLEFIYGNLVDRYPQIDQKLWQHLAELEAFVYLLAKWKELPIKPLNFDESSNKPKKGYNTDLRKLYMEFLKNVSILKFLLEQMFSQFGLVFSAYILIAYIALCKIQDELNYQEFSKPSDPQLIRFCADIRQLLDQPLSNFTNNLRYYLGQNPNNEFKTNVFPSLNQYIQTLHQSGKNAKTLSALIKSNQEQASRAKSQYETYWTQKKAFAGANIFISCEVKCAHFASNFKAIDHIFKTTIDKLNKDTSIQPLAYLGCWDILGHAAQINSANITFLFSVYKRDIAMEMDFIQHFMQKLEFVCKKYNDTKTESDDQVSITQTEDRFSTLVIRKLKAGLMQGEEKATIDAWFHYVSQKPLYLKILLDGEIKRAIKGSSNYKGRVKAKNLS
ncbi:hypothetical protein [Acinetobacter higginsii]|uniref:hypothetical protein n=1 Tax=Acinetobacter higginsii TaxID=70347 RepID=UPI002675910D|nr:hypothetical protein [Acinetobacter higginsii]MDO3664802.1 hypothetical protein [Acinetobacter higginsii]